MSEEHHLDFQEEHLLFENTLFEEVLPFWIAHSIDRNGGINTCIQDDGTLVNRDRWNWSQWRAVWVFSKLYNVFGKKKEWLTIAEGIYRFVTATGTDENGHWPLLLDGEGEIKRGYESLYVDGFAIYGLVELYRATGESEVLDLAIATFDASEAAFARPEPPPAWPYPIPPGRMPHGMSMLFSLAYHELAEVSNLPHVLEACLRHHRKVLEVFYRSDRKILLEWLNVEGTECSKPEGSAVCPGHAIESMWFQMHIARASGDQDSVSHACEIILNHLEAGWDSEFGGLFLAVDADGSCEVGWPHPDTKLWWPHTEGLYATLLAYEATRDLCFLEWYERVRGYAYNNFPNRKHGEWRQKLDRRGNVIEDTLFLPVKDPFHLPRALIYCIEVLKRLEMEEGQ